VESTKAIESATDILIQIKAAARRGGKVSTVTVYYPEASCTAGRAPFTQRKDTDYMNGAQALFKALAEAGLDTCFANPGTSEMQLLCEMGRTENVSAVLWLEEGFHYNRAGDPLTRLISDAVDSELLTMHQSTIDSVPSPC
jgi:Thiamine pyrophosphate enzyme, N-terminal TPP binding domain